MAQHITESVTSEAHPFGVKLVAEKTGQARHSTNDTTSASDHSSYGTCSSACSQTHYWKSYGRDISIVILFVVSMATLTVVIWHTVQTDDEVNRLQKENNDLREVINLLVIKTEQIENNDKNQNLLISTSTNQTEVAETLAELVQKDTELENTDSMLLNDVNNVTQKLVDVTDILTIISNNITVLESSNTEIQSLKGKVEDADPRETSTGSIVLAPGEQRLLFQVPCAGTYFFHIVVIVESGIGSQIEFDLNIGSFSYTISSSTPGETVVRAYTKELMTNDQVYMTNIAVTNSDIADFIINSHLIDICQ